MNTENLQLYYVSKFILKRVSLISAGVIYVRYFLLISHDKKIDPATVSNKTTLLRLYLSYQLYSEQYSDRYITRTETSKNARL